MNYGTFSFFGLTANPFITNTDPRCIFLTPEAEQTWAELTYGIHTRKGLILLTGEVGTGKTTLIRRLISWLDQQRAPTALILNPNLESADVLDFILNDFGIELESTAANNKLLCLNSWLLERYRAGQTPVLLVDEAQDLTPRVLEQIRLLLNFETPREKLLQIILVGRPELEEKLKRPELRQIRQRVTLRCKTAPFTLEGTRAYIQTRLRIAGVAGDSLFTPAAVTAVHHYSRGIPRMVNRLGERALTIAHAKNLKLVPALAISEAAQESDIAEHSSGVSSLDPRVLTAADLLQIRSIIDDIASPTRLPQLATKPRMPKQSTIAAPAIVSLPPRHAVVASPISKDQSSADLSASATTVDSHAINTVSIDTARSPTDGNVPSSSSPTGYADAHSHHPRQFPGVISKQFNALSHSSVSIIKSSQAVLLSWLLNAKDSAKDVRDKIAPLTSQQRISILSRSFVVLSHELIRMVWFYSQPTLNGFIVWMTARPTSSHRLPPWAAPLHPLIQWLSQPLQAHPATRNKVSLQHADFAALRTHATILSWLRWLREPFHSALPRRKRQPHKVPRLRLSRGFRQRAR
jgi:type II secretory pathway predicted ATPase ExeA